MLIYSIIILVIKMAKKIVAIGGGTGLSILLRGLKDYPLNITAVVSVCDDGKSTGKLRKEFNTPAVGDLRRVIVSLAETEPLFAELFNYRFKTNSELNGHTVGNLFLTAMSNITGNMSEGIASLSKVLNLKGTVLPVTEDNVTLVGKMEDGTIIKGEHNITEDKRKRKKVYYESTPKTNQKVIQAIREADMIILSMGSIFTSIIPNLLCKELVEEIDKSHAKIMYVCNMMTQPGETDDFKVSDHVKLLNSYLGNRKIDVVIANNKLIKKSICERYRVAEQKDQVLVDSENLKDVKLILSNLFMIRNNMIRHEPLKLALNIY